MVIKWMKRLKWMRISKYALIITLLLSLVFAGFTVYGARTGNFNIYLHVSDVQLAIYMKEDMSDLGTHLSTPVLDQMSDVTFADIASDGPRNQIMNGLGCKNDWENREYLAFSFVLKNFSDRMVNYDMELSIVQTREGFGGGDVTKALRVLVVKEWHYEQGSAYEALETQEQKERFFKNGTIYALPEETIESVNSLKENTDYVTEDFISEVQIFLQTENDLEVEAEVKYTFVFWLEGWDADCVNNLYGGKIQMRLDISGY